MLKLIQKHKISQIVKAILNLKKKVQFWMNHNTPNQIILQIYDNKNSVILAQKHICKPVE